MIPSRHRNPNLELLIWIPFLISILISFPFHTALLKNQKIIQLQLCCNLWNCFYSLWFLRKPIHIYWENMRWEMKFSVGLYFTVALSKTQILLLKDHCIFVKQIASVFFLLVAYFVLNLFSLFKCRHSCCRCHVTIHKVAKIPRVSDFHGLCLGLLKCNKITIKTKKS